MKERIVWIDALKMIGLFLVVLGHFLPSGNFCKVLIYSFHVPMFFIVSGFLDALQGKGRRFRFRALLVPWIFWGVLSYLIPYMLGHKFSYSLIDSLFPIKGFKLWNAPLWFLWALLWVDFLAPRCPSIRQCLCESSSKHWFEWLVISMGLTFAYLDFALGFGNVMAYRQVYLGIVFYEIGYLFWQYDVPNWLERHLMLCPALLCLGMVAGVANGQVSIYGSSIQSVPLLIVSAICLSLCAMLAVRKYMSWFSPQYLGGGIFVLCSHYYFLYLWHALAKKFALGTGILLSSVVACLVFVMCMACSNLFGFIKRVSGRYIHA